jgi:hypothetical protein
MAITDDLRKTFSDPTPLYFAAGAADLAFQEAKKVPALVEQLRTEAPARFEAVRNTDPKVVQEKAAARAKDAGAKAKEAQETLQTKVTEFGLIFPYRQSSDPDEPEDAKCPMLRVSFGSPVCGAHDPTQ